MADSQSWATCNPCEGDKAALPFHQQPVLLQQDLTEDISCSALNFLPSAPYILFKPRLLGRDSQPRPTMVKTYFMAPNFSTLPPPAGHIHLGSIIRDLTEFKCVNRTPHPIPECQLYPKDTKARFETSLYDHHSVNFGLAAKLLGLAGVGAGASIERAKITTHLIKCQFLDTIAFDATEEYINDSVGDSRVQGFFRSNKHNAPLYMVTGLKIARHGSVTSIAGKTTALEADVGIVPHGTPAEVGVRASIARNFQEGETFESLNDFIVSFQVVKIWRDRKGEVKHQPHTEMAVMQSGPSSRSEPEYVYRWDDELTMDEIDEMFSMEEDDI